jgi:hypothetical protein
MREPHKKGVAHHFGSESCTGVRKGAGEALTGVRTGQVWSSEITTSVCRPCLDTGKAIWRAALGASGPSTPRSQRP